LRARIQGTREQPLEFSALATKQGSAAERRLLESCERAIDQLNQLSAGDRELVRKALATITSGQAMDLQRFNGAAAGYVLALRTDQELDDYTYRVAGCVGEFWTRICRAHLFPEADLDEEDLLKNGVRFGKGLQLVNILRDLPRDLRQGRCYLPAEKLAERQLGPADLLRPDSEPRLRPLYDHYLARAEEHLKRGWLYTNTLPRRLFRVRLACAWPILIGFETIKLLRSHRVLSGGRPVKITRRHLRWLIGRSVLYYPWEARWRALPGSAFLIAHDAESTA